MNALYRFLVPDNALRVPWVETSIVQGQVVARITRNIHGRAVGFQTWELLEA